MRSTGIHTLKGLTLVEILVSMALIVILGTATASTILASQFLSSCSRHRIQAAYAAQQIIEQERRLAFSTIASVASTPVTLDTKGTYNTTTDDFNGNAVITVAAVDAYRKTVQVEVNWQEQITTGKVTMKEFFTTTIANEPEAINMARYDRHHAYTLVEVLIASVFGVFLLGAVVTSYNAAKKIYNAGIATQGLQDGANIVINQIIEGKTEPGGIFRLAEATSYTVVSLSELHFTGTDSIERWFYLNGASTALMYHHPTASGTINETRYNAPAGSTITLRFSIPAGFQYTGVVIGIDAALTQTLSGQALSGSASTYVNIRNHAV